MIGAQAIKERRRRSGVSITPVHSKERCRLWLYRCLSRTAVIFILVGGFFVFQGFSGVGHGMFALAAISIVIGIFFLVMACINNDQSSSGNKLSCTRRPSSVHTHNGEVRTRRLSSVDIEKQKFDTILETGAVACGDGRKEARVSLSLISEEEEEERVSQKALIVV